MTIEKRQLSEQNDNFIMLPTVEFCFKELMQNKEVRKGILSALLGRNPEELEDTELLPTILQPEYQDEKLGILDVRVLFADGTQTDLEMQVVQFDFWPNRVLFYLGKMYTGQIKRGEPYEKLKKCIHVSILDFLHFPKDFRQTVPNARGMLSIRATFAVPLLFLCFLLREQIIAAFFRAGFLPHTPEITIGAVLWLILCIPFLIRFSFLHPFCPSIPFSPSICPPLPRHGDSSTGQSTAARRPRLPRSRSLSFLSPLFLTK